MTIIELLNKIANGKDVPKEIKYVNKIYTLSNLVNDYMNEDGNYLTYKFNDFDILNDEVEILEDEKKLPEKLDSFSFKKETDDLTFEECEVENYLSNVTDKINEILDYLESKGK